MASGDGGTATQRWRLVLRRAASDATQRDHELAWEAALEASGLPCVRSTSGRRAARIVFAAPLPVRVAGEGELAEILLTDRRRSAEVREAVRAVLPSGTTLVDLHDVWLGAPGLPSLVVAAEYRIALASGPGSDAEAVRTAVAALVASSALPRVRGERSYDLRPLIATLRFEGGRLTCRLRHDPTAGAGRPDEVIAAIGDRLGAPLPVASVVRERLILLGDDEADGADGAHPRG